MISYSIIQKSQLEGAHRLDAEYYQPEYLEIHNKINSLGIEIKLLRDIIVRPVITGSTPKTRDCKGDDTDIKFVKTDTLREGEIVFENADCLPVKSSRKHSEPQLGDVLVTIIGATHDIVGRSAMVFADDPKMNINQNIVLIRVNTKLILPSFLEAFLHGKFGRDQLWQQSRQTEQVNLNCREVELVKIPLFSIEVQKNIDDLIILSRKLKNDSLILYQQAEELLLEEFGLQDFQVEDDLSFVVNLSDIKSAKRVDSDFFQPKYEALISHFKKLAKLLKSIVSRTTAVAKIDGEVEYKYIEISDINISNGEITPNIVMGRDLPANAKMKLNGGELLISKVRPTRGAVAIVPDSWSNNYVASGAFSIFNTDSLTKEYLQVALRSIIGKLQLEKPTTGTSYPTVTDQDVENILIPVLPKSIQQKIAELVRKSHEARKKSKELLEEAKRRIEEMIEKGEIDGQN